jgi:hypothetical protein
MAIGNSGASFDKIGNFKKNSPFEKLGTIDPCRFNVWHNDFDNYVAGQWEKTVVEAGSGSHSVGVVDGVAGGCLAVVTDNANGDRVNLQWSGGETQAKGTFVLDYTKKSYFFARFKCSDWSAVNLFVGLKDRDTAFDGLLSESNMHGVATESLLAAGTNIIFNLNSTGTSVPIDAYGDGQRYTPTITDDEFIEIGLIYRPNRNVGNRLSASKNVSTVPPGNTAGNTAATNSAYQLRSAYFRDAAKPVGQQWTSCSNLRQLQDDPFGGGSSVDATDWPLNANMMPTIMIQTKEAAANTLTVDYMTIMQER